MTVAPPSARLPIALIGAGGIGRTHADRLLRHPDVALAGIADPTPAGREFAQAIGAPWFEHAGALLDAVKPAAAIVATPNATHAAIGLQCIERGIAVLMEKPITDALDDGERLCAAAEAAHVPLLVGHQRRHSLRVRTAKAWVAAGRIGTPVAAHAMATWLKPDDYFNVAWRREPGGGPVLINLIHDIDMLRHLLCDMSGEVTSVQAVTSNAVRGHAVEDTAAVILRFAGGAVATLVTSDATPAPWNYDLGAGELERFPPQDVDALWLCGTEGSLTLPQLQLWRYAGARGWAEPLTLERTAPMRSDPYDEQLRHLRAVVEGRETPLCSGRDALATLHTARAVHEAAASGATVML
jgi:predicted dehydrogenase